MVYSGRSWSPTSSCSDKPVLPRLQPGLGALKELAAGVQGRRSSTRSLHTISKGGPRIRNFPDSYGWNSLSYYKFVTIYPTKIQALKSPDNLLTWCLLTS